MSKPQRTTPSISFSAPPPVPAETSFIKGSPASSSSSYRIAAGKVRLNLHIDEQVREEIDAEVRRLKASPSEVIEKAWAAYKAAKRV